MSIRKILFVIVILSSFVACNSNSGNGEAESYKPYVAVIDTSMTLSQVAKANKIGEPFLRTKLGVADRIGSKYTIVQMGNRFNFTIEDLRKVIEDQKNDRLKRAFERSNSEDN